MNRPSLSVVIPTHDTCELTLRCLASLAAGGVDTFEVVVVDDASNDGTAEEVRRRHPDAEVVVTDRNLGFGAAANLGVGRTAGDVALLLNSDTEVLEGGLAALVAAFADDPRLGVGGGELFDPGGASQWRAGRRPGPGWLFVQASGVGAAASRLPGRRLLGRTGAAAVGPVDWVTGAALAVRREAWRACGPLDEGYSFYCQDLDLCVTASAAGWKVAVVPGFRVLHHHGATIGRRRGAVGRAHPELLWTDLVRFVAKHDGPAAARRARTALRLGARLRLIARAAATPFVSSGDRPLWRSDSDAYRRGLDALR